MAKETATSRDFRNFSAPGAAPRTDLLRNLLAKRRPLVMGVLNVTPDSFSDGGSFLEPQAAIAQAQHLVAEGADILDVGALAQHLPDAVGRIENVEVSAAVRE